MVITPEEKLYILGDRRRRGSNNFSYLIVALTIAFILLLVYVTAMAFEKRDNQSYYLAAVIQYEHLLGDTPHKTIMKNIENYEKILEISSHYDTDIIIFPEDAITGNISLLHRSTIRKYVTQIPSPSFKEIPYLYEKYNPVLSKLSNAAKIYSVYVVANVAEIQYCPIQDPECPEDRGYYFSTDIVFDRSGALIAKCRKHSNLLCNASGFNCPKEAFISSFTTDFGVTFTNVCSDTSLGIMRIKNSKIIFSTTLQFQFTSNVFKSNNNSWVIRSNDETSNGDNLIYSSTNEPQNGTRLMIAKVPKNKSVVDQKLPSNSEK